MTQQEKSFLVQRDVHANGVVSLSVWAQQLCMTACRTPGTNHHHQHSHRRTLVLSVLAAARLHLANTFKMYLLNTVLKYMFCVLVHEYFHFIQLSTPTSQRQILCFVLFFIPLFAR